MAFDLIEGTKAGFPPGRDAYTREYSRKEIEEIVRSAGLTVVGYDEVEHEPGWSRLLVTCIKGRKKGRP